MYNFQKTVRIFVYFLSIVFVLVGASYVEAETTLYNSQKKEPASQVTNAPPSTKTAGKHVQAIANACPEYWEEQSCVKALSSLSLTIASTYMEDLHKAHKAQSVETVKQSCAASTAATKQDVPAYAIASAMVECANIISDVSQKTNISPNLDLYQVMVFSVFCLKKTERCPGFERQLIAFREQ